MRINPLIAAMGIFPFVLTFLVQHFSPLGIDGGLIVLLLIAPLVWGWMAYRYFYGLGSFSTSKSAHTARLIARLEQKAKRNA